ncbi:UPF0496 At4g34320-like [Olea europaea subsp. europaea]|uniref:UPF0496 At4g34320-like n=1 Tax=Olea europaea subsp. europaea TaxID=158383 RepID=A0A8S0VDK3_OLEEU|nr:UPF0496 At4g34320-like [Olea europaea subsp. europaea]
MIEVRSSLKEQIPRKISQLEHVIPTNPEDYIIHIPFIILSVNLTIIAFLPCSEKVKFKSLLRVGNQFHTIITTEQYSYSNLMPPPELPALEEARSSNDLQLQHRGDFRQSHLRCYEAACQDDTAVRTFDSTIQVHSNGAIKFMALGLLVPSLSFDSTREVTEYLLEVDPEVVKIILENMKDDIELSNLVDDYFQNSLQTLNFCTALDACLRRGGHIESILNVALRVFEEEHYSISGEGNVKIYSRTSEELRNLKAAVDPLIEEFLELFTSVYKQQVLMIETLQAKKRKLDKKLRKLKVRRKISNVISIGAFASVLISSVVAAAVMAPPVATALAAAAAVPSGSMGKWLDSVFRKREMGLRRKSEIITSMRIGSYTVIKELDLGRFQIEIDSLLENVDFATREEDSVVIAVEIQKKLNGFTKTIQDLRDHLNKCTRKIRKDRKLILQKIMNQNFAMS